MQIVDSNQRPVSLEWRSEQTKLVDTYIHFMVMMILWAFYAHIRKQGTL